MDETPGERLKKARIAAGYPTAAACARAFGWNENGYKAHENNERGIRPTVAKKYASALQCNDMWLLTGINPRIALTPDEADLLADYRALPPDAREQARRLLRAFYRPVGTPA